MPASTAVGLEMCPGSAAPSSSASASIFAHVRRWGIRFRPFLAIAAVGLIAYGNSFDTPFVFDGIGYVRDNRALHRLWPPQEFLSFVQSRPLAFFTFALNHAAHGPDVWGYHAVNLTIHVVNAWLIFLFVRDTLRLPKLSLRYGNSAAAIATLIALIWVAHPLCTQAVTYLYQRTESLASQFYIASLLFFLWAARPSADSSGRSRKRQRWSAVLSVACAVGAVSTKEIAATIPLAALWYDRACLANSWSEVWRARRRLHSALLCTWGVLAAQMIATADAYASAGIGKVKGVTGLDYALSQPKVLLHYLISSLWPSTLCLDWRTPVSKTFPEIVPPLVVVLGALATFLVGLKLGRAWSFLGGLFFLVLAPTSSFIPIADLSFEHRMYLPLAAVVAGVVLAAEAVWHKLRRQTATATSSRYSRWAATGFSLAVICALVLVTRARNEDYRSEWSIWEDVTRKAPSNPRAYSELARLSRDMGDLEQAEHWGSKCLEIDPTFSYGNLIYAFILHDVGRFEEAESRAIYGLTNGAGNAAAFKFLGILKSRRGAVEEELECYRLALELEPEDGDCWARVASALLTLGQVDAADEAFRKALEYRPQDPFACNVMGMYLTRRGDFQGAIPLFEEGIRLAPEYPDPLSNLGSALGKVGRSDEAIRVLTVAVRRFPTHINCLVNLGNAYARCRRFDEAVEQYEQALKVDPANATAAKNLATVQADRSAPPTADQTIN